MSSGQPVPYGVAKSLLIRYAKLCRQADSVKFDFPTALFGRSSSYLARLTFANVHAAARTYSTWISLQPFAHVQYVLLVSTFAQIQSLTGSGHDRLCPCYRSIREEKLMNVISLRFLGISLRVLRREVSVYNVYITN